MGSGAGRGAWVIGSTGGDGDWRRGRGLSVAALLVRWSFSRFRVVLNLTSYATSSKQVNNIITCSHKIGLKEAINRLILSISETVICE